MSNINLNNIIELLETKSVGEANRYLKDGWILISTHLTDYGHPVERHQDTVYCLGWNKENGDVRHPEKPESDYTWPFIKQVSDFKED